MHDITTDYPDVPWEPDWRICSAPQDATRFAATDVRGRLTAPGASWTLQLASATLPGSVRLFHNGLSILGRRPNERISLFCIDDGVLTGIVHRLPLPTLSAPGTKASGDEQTWIAEPQNGTLLLCREDRFALVTGCSAEEPARARAEQALDEDIHALIREETERRRPVASLFSINSRHNPPVALAAETLHQRLRSPAATLHGLWSTSDGFEHETFSLNELYPLTCAWILINPDIAMKLVRTALSLQQPTGAFPAWINRKGETVTTAPWPMIIQSVETVWNAHPDPDSLQQHIPALRKYIQWALRYFDPHRDGIPAWQSEQELFIPNSFERNKATPDLTAMLLAEIEALQRLCEKSGHTQAASELLSQEHQTLRQALETVFWNPELNMFSNAWKDGHTLHDPSFASFTPLLIPDLPDTLKKPVLEQFNETHGFPGQKKTDSWKREPIDDTTRLPAIHLFTTFEALRRSGSGRAIMSLFVHRVREGVATWLEREEIDTARHEESTHPSGRHIFSLGPVNAALILCAQNEFRQEADQTLSVRKTARRLINKLNIRPADVTIVLGTLLALLIVHQFYIISVPENETPAVAEAALYYQQRQMARAMDICRRYPEHPLSNFLQANLLILSGHPADAEAHYLKTLRVNIESPSALFGYALALQMNGNFELAIRRYNDFIDIHEVTLSRPGEADLIDYAYVFLQLAEQGFKTPPKWRNAYALPIMNDLGL